jgi:hypothetical protein
MASAEALELGARLDEHHLPETNGRIAVCRRCGARTYSPLGRKHLPDERQLARINAWLDAQSRINRIARVNGSTGRTGSAEVGWGVGLR